MRAWPARLAAVLLLALPAALHAQRNLEQEIQSNQARLDSIRQERSRLEGQLSTLRGRMRNISSEIDNLERQKSATGLIVNELDRQMRMLGMQLDTVTSDLVLTEDELAAKRAIERRRIVEIYKRGPLWDFEVLLSAQSFSDLLSRYK
jgi:peptidoglycan hydrolase CwlO-like protein